MIGLVHTIVGYIESKWLVFIGLVVSVVAIVVCMINYGIPVGLGVASLPLLILVLLSILRNPFWGFLILFTLNYFIVYIIRFTQIDGLSVLIDGFILLTFFAVLLNTLVKPTRHLDFLKNRLILVAFIWFVYCCLQALNPSALLSAWLFSRGLTYYFLTMVMLTFLVCTRLKDVKILVYLLSVFTLMGVAKAIMQQIFGFDTVDNYFLNSGGERTHLLASGTRYFSFYASAGIFGAVMGHALVVFTILAFYVKSNKIRIYFVVVALAALYGLIISGTRGAMAVPAAGLALFSLLSKKWSITIPILGVLLGTYLFLGFTTIGQSNAEIRRMRTIFNPNEPSLVVRKENQKLLANYLKNKPFGEGLGLSGVDVQGVPPRFTTSIPTDSWYVKIWVETGIVGLILHIAILLYVVIYGSYLVLFRIRDRIVRGFLVALLCGVFGILISSYGNQVLGQFPVVMLVYMSMAFVFMAKYLDNQVESN